MMNTNQNNTAQEFIHHAIYQMELNLPRIEKCFAQLSEAEIWMRPNPKSNSIGNLILHLSGNIRQWIIASIGGKKDIRTRDAEFSAKEGTTKQALYALIETTIQEAIQVIRPLKGEELLTKKSVQGFDYSTLGNIFHVVEHLSYHVGQIAFWTKALKNRDLGFYADMDSLNENV